MKKTKFLTCLAALTLLLAGCETTAENLGTDTSTTESGDTTTSDTGTTESGDTESGEGGDTGEGGGDGSGESRLGLLGEAFKLVGAGNYTLSSYSTAVSTDDHLSYTGVVTDVGVISTNYANNNKTSGMIEDPEGGFVEVELVDGVLVGQATPDTSRSIKDYFITSDIDTSLFEQKEDGLFALKDEGFNSDVLGDLFPDKPFTGGLNYATQGTIFIDVADDLSKITYYYDSSFLGTYTVTLVVTNLGTTVFPYDLETDYVRAGSIVVSSWAEYLSESVKEQIDELLGKDLDEVLPFYLPDEGYEYARYQSSSGGRFNFGGKATQDTYDTWEALLTQAGYTYTDGAYYNDEGYKVTIQLVAGYFDLYLYPPEKIAEPTTWSEYLAANAGSTSIDSEDAITALLGASLDEILPYVVPECGYNFITVDNTTGCVSFTLDNATYAASTLAEWKTALIAFGYTDLGNLTYQNEAGYKVTLTDWTILDMIYVYVYPPVAESEGPTSWAEFINNDYDLGVLYNTLGTDIDNVLPFYYEETGYSAYYAVSGVRFYLSYYYPSNTLTDGWIAALTEFGYTLESSASNGFGGTTYTLTYNGYEVEIITSSFGEWTLNLYPPEPEPEGPTSWAEFINNDYDLGVLSTLLGEDIDNVLPFYFEETGYQQYYAVPDTWFYLYYWGGSSTLTDGWIAALTDFGYTLESSASNNMGGTTYTYTWNGYAVEIRTSSYGEWGLYLYPKAEATEEGGVADQINAVVSKLTEVGSDFDYDSGFYYENMELRPGDDLSAYYYDALTITATTDNRGYMVQSSMDILDLEDAYYSYEYFSDGTDTYYYDAENGQSKEEELYEFDVYQAMAEMYFDGMDFDQVLELIEDSASVSDIEVDEDYEISDDTIYIYANNEDYSLYYELDVEYDENGLTYFSFSYMDDLYAYAVALTPAEYVDDPEWYVPDDGGDAELTGWAAIVGEDIKAQADALLGADLDTILPAIAPDGGYTYVYVRSADFYVDYENYSDLDACQALEDEFVAALLELGYTQTGGDIYSGIIYTSDSYQVTVTDMFWMYMGSVSFAIQAL